MKLTNKKILVTGGAGFLGRYVVEKLAEEGVTDILAPHSNYDLRVRSVCETVVKNRDIVIHLAAQIGGIGYISEHPGEMFYNNLVMGLELMEASRKEGVKKFVTIGTVCEYPKIIPLPFKEEHLWDGSPEETTAPYGWAKKMLIVAGQNYKKQYNFNSIHLLPVNLYGPRDNFDRGSHVIPALIKKIVEAKQQGRASVDVWGTGNATREFLYVEDAAEGIVLAAKQYNSIQPVNVGTGRETSIKEVTQIIMDIVGYTGSIHWNTARPDGQPRRQLDVSRAKQFGFEATTDLRDGLEKTIQWYMRLPV